MALTLKEKKAVVDEVAKVAANAHSAVAVEYRGLTVDQLTGLRARARGENVYLRVVKNSLARRAIEGTQFACLGKGLSGPLMLAFSRENPSAAARLLRDFARQNDQLIMHSAAVDGQLLGAAEIDRLADMPTRDQAIAMLMSVIQAPVAKLARALNEVPSKLVRAVDAIRVAREATQPIY